MCEYCLKTGSELQEAVGPLGHILTYIETGLNVQYTCSCGWSSHIHSIHPEADPETGPAMLYREWRRHLKRTLCPEK